MFLRTGQRGANALERGGPDRRAPEWSPECKAPERRSAAGERSTSGEHGTAGVRTILGRRNIAGVRSGDGGHTGALERRVADRTEVVDTLGRLSAGRREVLIRSEIATDELYVGGRELRILRVGGAGQISKNRTPSELEIPISVCFCQAAELFEATDEHKRVQPKARIL